MNSSNTADTPGIGTGKTSPGTSSDAFANPLSNPISASLVAHSAHLSLGELFANRVRMHPDRIALEDGPHAFTYRKLDERANRFANFLADQRLESGDRIAVLSENRHEYLEVVLAAAKLGVIAACINWRLSAEELEHCVTLVTPKLTVVSPRYESAYRALNHGVPDTIVLGEHYEGKLGAARPYLGPRAPAVAPEDGLLIIYTSGTTGLPKGALISHRAELARMHVSCVEFNLSEGDTFVAWPPMFHMASTEQALHVLLCGGKVISVDGFDVERIVDSIATDRQWWLILMPGMIDQIIEAVRRREVKPAGLKMIGAMADLVPPHQIAEVSELLQAPYANTFGATETGIPPASRGQFPSGDLPTSLSKEVNYYCQFRLVDADDNDVPTGTPGELAFRGPTLFSGYWNAPEVNARDFRGGWFHMGDCFIQKDDGRLDFVDRVKYMIKSGGENIYPAEIERVILADARVDDAVVVRSADERWGEVPVAFVARNDESLTAQILEDLCLRSLARYKRPRQFRFVEFETFPRSTTGKIQRHEVEKWLDQSSSRAGIPGLAPTVDATK